MTIIEYFIVLLTIFHLLFFFVSGTASCYVSNDLIQKSNSRQFLSKFPLQLCGVGAKTGPIVNQDCLSTVKLTDGFELS